MAQPTLDQLRDAYINDIETELGITIPEESKNFLFSLSSVHAARIKLLYLNQAKLQKNIFADTAEYESQGGTLERFGRVKLNRSPFPAVAGEYTVQFTGTPGVIIPASTVFNADDSSSAAGFRFILDSSYTLVAPFEATVRSLDAGIEAKLEVADTLTLSVPAAIANVDSKVVVVSEVTEPQTAEDLEEYREKILEAFILEAQGGAGADYRIWSADAQGVEQVYPFTAQVGNSIEVNLYVEGELPTYPNGVPTQALLDAVEEAIEEPTATTPSRKPLTAVVNYLPVTALEVNVTVNDYISPTPTAPTTVQTSLEDLINGVRPYVGSIDPISKKNDIISQFNIIGDIYSAAPGSQFTSIELEVDGNIVTEYQFELGDIPYIGTVTINVI